MLKHIDRLAVLFEQLANIVAPLHSLLAYGLLIAFIEVEQLRQATITIKTLSEIALRWEYVSSRSIEEVQPKNNNGLDHANAAALLCVDFGRSN